MGTPILQFGTGRFLQAHADLFVSQALERGAAGAALGGITVVQTSGSAASLERVAALARPEGYDVHVRGLRHGERIDTVVTGRAVRAALRAAHDWPRVVAAFTHDTQVFISNTADRGYELDAADSAACLAAPDSPPRSYPAKLLALLHARWAARPQAPLSLFPCELIARNGDTLRDLVCRLAAEWSLDAGFIAWVRSHCVWANSLVDRIVSQPLHPVGAVAEPYALWAIEQQPRLVLPCAHEAIVVTDRLEHFARLKLWLLNGGHTFLAERWLADRRAPGELVREAMQDAALRGELEALWADELLPVFDALGERAAAQAYIDEVRERFMNPFLEHRLAEIAQNHATKKQRRMAPVVALAAERKLDLPLHRLRAALASPH